MSENIAAAHRWAIDKGAARTKVTPESRQSQIYYGLRFTSVKLELSFKTDNSLRPKDCSLCAKSNKKPLE